MDTANENEMVFRPQPPVFRQIAAFVFGLIFAFTNGYSGLQTVGAAICAPLCFAGAIRLYTGVYRVAFCVLPIMWIAVIAGIFGIGIVISFLLTPAFRYSTALGVILTGVLMLCEVFVFIRDIQIWKKNRKDNG